MALVFQYGSNLSTARFNHETRLKGDAVLKGIAETRNTHEFVFDIWSTGEGGRAAADIVVGADRKIFGVIYDIPDYLIRRETAKAAQRKSLDAIEGEGSNYERTLIELNWADGRPVTKPVITYIGKAHKAGIKTNQEYVNHILLGMAEHKLPTDYVLYVKKQIVKNNPDLKTETQNPAE